MAAALHAPIITITMIMFIITVVTVIIVIIAIIAIITIIIMIIWFSIMSCLSDILISSKVAPPVPLRLRRFCTPLLTDQYIVIRSDIDKNLNQ